MVEKPQKTTTNHNSATTESPKTAEPTASTKVSKKKFKITKAQVFFTIFVLAWTLLANIASQYVIAFPMAWILGDAVQQPVWTLVYYLLTYALTLALVIIVPPRLVKSYHKHSTKKNYRAAKQLQSELATTPTSLGVQHAPTFVDIGLAPVGYILYCVLATVLTTIMSSFAWFNADQAQDVGFSYFITDIDRIIAMLAIVFIAPIAEEIIMRGWLYGKVRDKWNIPISIILTSLLFAFLHGQWNVAVSTFALSVILCGLREITGTIWSGMLLHILSNGIAFYLLYVAI